MDLFEREKQDLPFAGYQEYAEHLFACADRRLADYITGLMEVFAADNGRFKNALYPDIEAARDLCQRHLMDVQARSEPPGGPAAIIGTDV